MGQDPNLIRYFRVGKLDASAYLEIIHEGTGWALIDALNSMPPATSVRSMKIAIEKAKEASISYFCVRNSSHFGAAGYYGLMAAKHDMIGLASCNMDPEVIVPGFCDKVLGTNPLAYAVRADREKPTMFDIATSAVAATKVFIASHTSQEIPSTWLVDKWRKPTTDPHDYLNGGSLQPFAGHKGYGLALLVEVLSAVLTGAAVTKEGRSWLKDDVGPPNEGHAFIAINIGLMMDLERFKERVDRLIREIKSAPKSKGINRIHLLGEMQLEKQEKALAYGMMLPSYVIDSLSELADDLKMELSYLFSNSGNME